jgi:hypothetical protein
MKQAMGMICAGLLLAGVGCTWNAGGTRVDLDVKINDHSLDETLDAAVAKLQRELQKRGLEATISAEGDTARVKAKTKYGDEFTVVFNRTRDANGKEQTRLRVEWGARPDRELWLGLMLAIGASELRAS